jgi:putative hemolysin
MRRRLIALLLIAPLVIAACGAVPTPAPTPDSPYSLPNEASEHCLAQGYQLEMYAQRNEAVGYCLFPDGTRCELWAFYRGECEPGTPEPVVAP